MGVAHATNAIGNTKNVAWTPSSKIIEKGRLKTRYRFQTTFMFEPAIVFRDGSIRNVSFIHEDN